MDNFDFKKIELKAKDGGKEDSPQMMKKKKRPLLKTILKIIIVPIIIIIVFSVFVALKVQTVYKDVLKVEAQAKKALDVVKQQNVIAGKEELLKTDKEISQLKKDLDSLSFLKYIPIANNYYQDSVYIINASSYGVSAGITVMDSLIPYADVLGLKGKGSFVGGSAEQRIQTAVGSLGKIVLKIDDIESNFTKAKEEIDKVDPNHYPKVWKFTKVRDQIESIKTLMSESGAAIKDAKPLIKVLPNLLGEPDTKKYLILFQNDKELRPTGGFITFYSIFRIEHGVIHVEKASDIYDLDNSIASHPKASDIILKYLPKVYAANIRDSNLSPDFVTSMDAFNELYNKSSQKVKVDGIIAIDTHVLAHFLEILGDVQAGGVTFNSKIDPRCNCPQVVYQLEAYATTQVGHVVENRKAIIGELLYAIMGKALSSSPKEYWGRLFQQAMKDAQEKHILFYLYDKDAQSGLEALNLAGRIKDFEGDYLHINDSNFGGAKSNMYVKQSVKVEYDVDKEGKIIKTVTVDYKNPYQASNCNLEQKEVLCLNAILRNYLRIYVPKGSNLIDSKGSEVKVGSSEDLGKTVLDGFFTVRPLGKSQVMFKYELPFKLDSNSNLPVFIQKQSGTDGTTYDIIVNGIKKDSFILNSDKIINLKVF